MGIVIKSDRELAKMREAGHIVRAVLDAVEAACVPGVVGHGIGRAMHEPPGVPNYGTSGRGLRLRAGMVLAIEPMLNAGRAEVTVLEDGWTVVTADASLSAHVEHTVAITADGPRVLTAA
jgi:methionyl aminopeptidase